jgi:hypothetical protein
LGESSDDVRFERILAGVRDENQPANQLFFGRDFLQADQADVADLTVDPLVENALTGHLRIFERTRS